MRKTRQANYELLRIIAMLMIICLHYLSKGGALASPDGELSANGYAAWLIEAFCLVAVNCYVLISGYFGVDSHFSWKRPFRLWCQVWLYSAVIGLFFLLTGQQEWQLDVILSYLCPIVTEHYWFATAFLVLSLITPFLNAGFMMLDQRNIQIILGLWLLLFSFAKTLLPMQLPWDFKGYDCLWFLGVYLTGAYIRRYPIHRSKGALRGILLYSSCALLTFASMLVIRTLYMERGVLQNFISYAYSYNHVLCYVGSIGLFAAFGHVFSKSQTITPQHEKRDRIINTIAGATFGVYLLHEHRNLRNLWPTWFSCGEYAQKSMGIFLLHMLITVVIVFAAGILVELMRQNIRVIGKKLWGMRKLLMMLVLLLYPLRKAVVGLDLMDAGYALGNYRFFDTMNETWKMATYLANVCGVLFSELPFGGTWVGMNVYTGLLLGVVSAATFYALCRFFPECRKELLFLGELVALSLCWSPGVILYHYLGYEMMTIAVLLLFWAIKKENKPHLFIIAGVILGASVLVRMPNITYMALILPVWYAGWLRAKQNKPEAAKMAVKQTLWSIGGYLAGLGVPLMFIGLRYGFASYFGMISSLFGVTDTATDYKPTSMITAMFEDYIQYSVWLLLFIAYAAAGVLFLTICRRLAANSGKPFVKVGKLLYLAGMAVLLRFCYGRGMFGLDFTVYFSMYKWVTVSLLCCILGCILLLIRWKKANGITDEERIWAVFLLVVILITPLGSNNGLYPLINNLFLVAPVSAALVSRHLNRSRLRSDLFGFAARSMSIFLFGGTAVVSLLFGIFFVFHDAPQGEAYAALELDSLGYASTTGLYTTVDKKMELEALGGYLQEEARAQQEVILYGDIPALAYIFDLRPAVYTSWPDLDSNVLERLQEDMDTLLQTQQLPMVIVGERADTESPKWRALYDFLMQNGYQIDYESASYTVYQ